MFFLFFAFLFLLNGKAAFGFGEEIEVDIKKIGREGAANMHTFPGAPYL